MNPNSESFPWYDTAARLRQLSQDHELVPDAKGRSFRSESLRVVPPIVFPIPEEAHNLADYLATLPEEPTRHLVLLMQAGATAMGWFEAGEVVRTKSDKKYVVRGRGKAQPTHLSTKGKSRYGSRLRLQNARSLQAETIERLIDWWDELGTPDEVFYSAPVRLWTDLFECDPAPPFARKSARKIPLDVPVPTTETLLRTYTKMTFGQIYF